ncbi:biopolymer transporter ExbD [Pandoraea nosoerga]|uniref:Biopolymer transporter ExbD n=1 Tax=Pandoraea nosoerga TaxID=2508296 RepID=A0A5E4WXU5_9BURK|nr:MULTISPECIES: biopolymer transporter ExbD [Pandoraea]MBN4666372.1 biopolymer transporter ExbD [Pandoraea nosoerga]MBN4675949.1 biopolymer transporter ExbD [Pandoraea nosoerga]MBN4682044.1 biopolymer transporter ExbD [Pandoraea nosoerga]MBN4746434.1 biopolymer transporter ExbD [Pandoraea nosoerga]VVE27796.1 biopolymer transporter ExbD [Pandoraea nosoerga]
MNFRRGLSTRDEPEINLIPLIDVLLVILIFLMVTTTYTRYTALKVNLPTADAEKALVPPRQIVVSVGADGSYAIDRHALAQRDVASLAAALRQAAGAANDGAEAPVVIVNADAKSAHQSVINVMEAAREAGLTRLTFSARSTAAQGAAKSPSR